MTRLMCLLLLVGLTSCDRSETNAKETPNAALAPAVSSSPPPSAEPLARAHDPSNPPIDCPLREHGINPHAMKPFEDVEKYIAFLEREDRAVWQKPDAVVAALQLSGSETVADVGAGSGYFSFRFAKALPKGRVVAIDIEPEMIRHIHHKAMSTGVRNVAVEIAEPDDPSVPKDADWVFICDVLHHVKDRPAWLARLHQQMKPGGKVALIEFKEGELPEGPPASLKLGTAALNELMSSAGFTFVGERKDALPYQHLLFFRKG